MNSKIDVLLNSANQLKTRLGAWIIGETVIYRGHDLFKELKDASWMELLLLGITGRKFTKEQAALFEKMWTLSVSYPDPRLWNNRIAALAGSARSTAALGVGAATAITEAKIYGGQANYGAILFLQQALKHSATEQSLVEFLESTLRKKRSLPGYGRPIVARDERIEPVLTMATNLGMADGECLKLALRIEGILKQGRWRMAMNITGLCAALAVDQGLSPREYQLYVVLAFGAGILPCYADAVMRQEGAFFPIPCDAIDYRGPQRRTWQ